MLKLSLVLIFFLTSLVALGDNTITQVTIDGVSTSDVPERARAESLKDALDQGSIQVIKGLIGEGRYQRNSNTIQTKILSQTSKFVQYYKASEPVVKGSETHTDVTMKISVSSLKDLLSAQGLLFQNEGPPTILPVVNVIEKRENGKQFSWWTDEASPDNAALRDDAKFIIGQFDSVFRPKNFYVMDPLASHFVQWIPANYRVGIPGRDQVAWFGKFFKAQIVVLGSAELIPTDTGTIKLNVQMKAYHSDNAREVGEVSRVFESDHKPWDLASKQVLKKGFAEVTKDLANQILDESSRGTLGASSIRVTLHGPFQYQDIEEFKKEMVTKIGEVKTVRERFQATGTLSFDVDYTGNSTALAKAIQSSSFQGFKLALQSTDPQNIDLTWSKVEP